MPTNTLKGTKDFTKRKRQSIIAEAAKKGVNITLAKYEISLGTFYYWKYMDKNLKRLKDRYSNDEEFRSKTQKYYREKYQTDEEYHIKTLEQSINRYHTDEKYRRASNERSRKNRKNN